MTGASPRGGDPSKITRSIRVADGQPVKGVDKRYPSSRSGRELLNYH